MSDFSISGEKERHVFSVDFKSSIGKRYTGSFAVRRPKIDDHLLIAAKKSDLLGGRYYDDENPGRGVPSHWDSMAEARAFLSVCIEQSPDWWDDGNVDDMEILFHVFGEAVVVDPFRARLINRESGGTGLRFNESSGKAGGDERHEAESEDIVTQMVDE